MKTTALFGKAIKSLRLAIGKTQESAAHAIGVTTKTWSDWELRGVQPRRSELEKICSLAADPAVRIVFWLDIYLVGVKLRAPEQTQQRMSPREALLLRYMEDSVMALRALVTAAADGSTASEELLRLATDQLLRASGDAQRHIAARNSANGKNKKIKEE